MNHKDSHWSQCQIADLPGLLVVDCPMEELQHGDCQFLVRIPGDWRLLENFGSFCVCHPFFGVHRVHVLSHLTWPMFFLHSCPLPSIWWKDCPICLTELQPGENARDPSWFNGGWPPIWYLHFFHKRYLNGTKRYQPPSFSKTTWNYKAHKLPKIQWFKTSLTNFINWSNLIIISQLLDKPISYGWLSSHWISPQHGLFEAHWDCPNLMIFGVSPIYPLWLISPQNSLQL